MAIQKFLLLLSLSTLLYPSGCFDLDGLLNTFKEKGFQDGIQKAVDELTTREVIQEALIKVLEKTKSEKNVISQITHYWSGTIQSIKCDVTYSDCSQEDQNEWMVKCLGCVASYMHAEDENGKHLTVADNHIAEYIDVQKLFLEEFPLDYIPPVIFYVYKKLDSINYRKSKTTRSINARFLPPKSSQLNSIELTDNVFRSLDKDAFLAAKNARTVDLSRNEISYIDCDAFKGLAQIKTLKIVSNKLRILEDCYFEDLNTLDLLHIDQNEIAEVEDETFKSLKNLKTLSLKQNAVKNINRKTFSGLEKLEDLNFSANRMKILKAETFSELKMIKNLDLSNNIIEVIHKDVFSGVNYLKNLHFQNNKMKRLPAESITNLHILSYLNLMNNFCINDLFYDITEAKKNLELSCEPKPSDCLIPDIKNGRVISGLDDTNITAGELYDDIYPVKVHCNPGYSMLILRESDNLIFCLNNDTSTNQWNKEFLECQKLCLGSKLIGRTSWATRCYVEDELSHECLENSKPGTEALVECRPGYKLSKGSRFPTNVTCLSDGNWDHQLFDCEPKCGTPTPKAENFIIGGVESNVTEFPWNVAVYQKQKTEQVLICGGTILTERIVLSAAHCFYQGENSSLIPIEDFMIVAGKYFLDFDAKESLVQQVFGLTKIMKPTQYHGTYNYNKHDIAILILSGFIEFWPHVAPICLDMNLSDKNLEPGTMGKVAGWGFSEITGYPSEILKSIEVPVVSKEECLEKASEEYLLFVTEDKLCAGFGDGVGVCKGDSGAGLVFPKKQDRKLSYFLWGIVSNGPQKTTGVGGCDLKHFTLYTNVQHYIHFISEAMQDYPSL